MSEKQIDINQKIINNLIEKEKQKDSLKITSDDIKKISDKDSIVEMFHKIRSYKDMLSQRMTFITEELTKMIPFTKENLYLICGYSGNGKCEKINTPILMYDGTIKMIQDIKVGELLMGPDSTPRKVVSLARGREEMYDIIPVKGDKYTVNKSHILSLKWSPTRKTHKAFKKDEIVNISISDYFKMSRYIKSNLKGWKPEGIDFKDRAVTLDPYFIGAWLGDGTSGSASITTKDKEIISYINKYAKENGLAVTKQDSQGTRCPTYRISTQSKRGGRDRNPITNGLKKYNLINNKHIPMEYKCNSKEKRLQLLAGLIDTDGHVQWSNSIDYISKSKVLADDVAYLCRSLGFAAYVKPTKKSCNRSDGSKFTGTYYRVSISGNIKKIPLKIKRKRDACKVRKQIKNVLYTGIKVIPVGIDNYYGFELDGPDHLYLHGDFTVTHNTSLSANIAYPLWQENKKILWISNEENKEDIMMRIACLHYRYTFNDYKKGYMEESKIGDCMKLFPTIAKYVHIFDVGYRDGLTTKVEAIMNILEAAKAENQYSCILLDYYQLVKFSINNPTKSAFQVLDDFRIFLMRYIKGCNIPVVLFAQLHSIGKRNNKALDSRIKDGPTIYEAATVVMEIVPDFEKSTTDVIIHKDRFGLAGNRLLLGFDKGKFVRHTPEFSRSVTEQALDKMQREVESRSNGSEVGEAVSKKSVV